MIYITGTRDIHLENTAVALGKFDGLHRGHQILIEKIKQYKSRGLQAVMFTFDFHPASFIQHKPLELIFTREERIKWAEKMGIDAQQLVATVEEYNASVEKGVDEAFGREKALSKLETAPFYAASGKPSNHICAGGILTDGKAQVLDADNNPIEGLYAAGETVNLAYHPLCSALTFGRVTAEQVAQRLAE